ncbi:MAG TPA: hypothetical protein VMT03_19225 [Polyangia bacterium]|nr:hypothetical protein [Polyangia bacterium]
MFVWSREYTGDLADGALYDPAAEPGGRSPPRRSRPGISVRPYGPARDSGLTLSADAQTLSGVYTSTKCSCDIPVTLHRLP